MNLKCTLLLSLFTIGLAYAQEPTLHMQTLFNGGDLSQWEVPENNIWWTIEGETLWAKSDPDQKGSILWTKNKYTDFVIQLDFKFGEGTVDSGIFMRGDDEKNAQIQIGISGSLNRDMTGSPYVPKAGYPVEAVGINELLKLHDWNTIRAVAIGNTYQVWLNGKAVMKYALGQANLEGPIGLQLHPGKEMSIQFKNIQVAPL